MQYIDKDQVVMFDVDGTLVQEIAATFENYMQDDSILIIDPYTKQKLLHTHMLKNIELMKKWKARGRFVIVWSAGGHAWAKAVIEALQLQQYVDLIIEKPIAYVDDLTANEFMGTRVFLND